MKANMGSIDRALRTLVAVVMGACGRTVAPSPVDPTAMAQHVADSVLAAHTQAAPALAEKAFGTMVQLLKNPATAKFDSVIVTQPAMSDGSWPLPAVCGRIGGKPGIKGTSAMTPFIYLNPMTVFVLDATNAEKFAAMRAKQCDGPGVRVLR